jgi:site-specific recombinase XerD
VSTNVVKLPVSDPWSILWASFERSLRAENRSVYTIKSYAESSGQFLSFQAKRFGTVDPKEITKADAELFLIHLREQGAKENTVRLRFSALRRFFNWLVEEEEITVSPIARLHVAVPSPPPPDVLTLDECGRLLKTCDKSKTHDGRRDAAIIRLMLDTGLRRFEVLQMTVEDAQAAMESGSITVLGKGKVVGQVFIGAKTVAAIDRYIRVRALHPKAKLPALWLAHKGALTGSGIYKLIVARSQAAGIAGKVWPHLLRHTWAHHMKSSGASDEVTMELGRWRDPKVMARYGASAARARAAVYARQNSLGDRLL